MNRQGPDKDNKNISEKDSSRSDISRKSLPVHFFTIVLNGQPFIRYHLDVFKRLPFSWHWHIIEGVADLVNDTAWSKPLGGYINPCFHRQGRSLDGTGAYLDEIAGNNPGQVTIYRKPKGEFWNGKLEMINAPLAGLNCPCILWQVDVDEFWTSKALVRMHKLFMQHPDKTAAYFYCNYFVGPLKYVVSMNTWATGPLDWLRAWRYNPQMRWAAHEPPQLVDSLGRDVGRTNPFPRDYTLARGISFQHYAYVLESQVRFKESYYGYTGAVEKWRRLNRTSGKLKPADFLHWAGKDAWADDWNPAKGKLLLAGLLVSGSKGSYCSISVKRGTAFEDSIRRLVRQARPRTIIETGTYLGRGTTTIVWKALQQAGIDPDFTTIEVNPEYHRQAKAYFDKNGMRIRSVCGLSLERSRLPSKQDIQRKFVDNKDSDRIYYDHPEHLRSEKYFSETDFQVPDNQLEYALKRCNWKPDLVLLDSAGHLGFEEFELVRRRVKGTFHLVLDDVHHCKHHRSLNAIKSDPRFELLEENDEKFGYAIARFKPVRCMVFLRTDSIGDSLLASTMIEPLYNHFSEARIIVVCQEASAPVYERIPFVARVIKIPNEHKWKNSEQYQEFLKQIKAENPDLLLNTVYSVHEISDLPGLEFIERSVAFRNTKHASYKTLVDPGSENLTELQRHARFLDQIGIAGFPSLMPAIDLKESDLCWARDVMARYDLEPERTMALFPASRVEIKNYGLWDKVLEPLCQNYGFKVIALGSEKDYSLVQEQFKNIQKQTINLCGRTSLFQAAALLKLAAVAAGCDTSLVHMACAVGTTNVVVVGGGHFGRFLPYSPLTSVVCQPLDCYGCQWRCSFPRAHCIEDICPELVQKAIQEALEQKVQTPRIYWQSNISNVALHGSFSPRPSRNSVGPKQIACETVLPQDLDVELVEVGSELLDNKGNIVIPGEVVSNGAGAFKRTDIPRISIVTPCLNQAEYLEQCICSILNQDYPNLEYIIIDGGSSDGSLDIIKKYASRLAFWKSGRDDGQYPAIDEGFRHATGQIMTWLNADDFLYPGTLETVAAIFLQRPDVEWITGLPNSLDINKQNLHVLSTLPLWSYKRYLEKRYFAPFIQQEGTFWRRSLWEKSGAYLDPNLEMAGDLELWARFFRHADLHSVDLTLAVFRQHPDQKTARHMELYFMEAEKVLNREISLYGRNKSVLHPAPVPITFAQVNSYLAATRSVFSPYGSQTQYSNKEAISMYRSSRSKEGLKDSHFSTACKQAGRFMQKPKEDQILVSAIVSTFNAENFMDGCLADLERQTIADRLEIIVVDSGSEQDEAGIVKRYQEKYNNIRYIRTEKRESVYQAWNRAVETARGKYLTSANTDDRHRPDAFEQMLAVLETKREIALVYADVIVTDKPCEGMHDCIAKGHLRWHDWNRQLLLEEGCFIGPQPMWRKAVHEFFGLFPGVLWL